MAPRAAGVSIASSGRRSCSEDIMICKLMFSGSPFAIGNPKTSRSIDAAWPYLLYRLMSNLMINFFVYLR